MIFFFLLLLSTREDILKTVSNQTVDDRMDKNTTNQLLVSIRSRGFQFQEEISSSVFSRRNKLIQNWKNLRVSKWWQDFHFCVNCLFNSQKQNIVMTAILNSVKVYGTQLNNSTWSHKNTYLCALSVRHCFTYLTAHFAAVSKRNVHWVALKHGFNMWTLARFYYVDIGTYRCVFILLLQERTAVVKNSNIRGLSLKVNALSYWKYALHQTQP